jgi:hypothetical protein
VWINQTPWLYQMKRVGVDKFFEWTKRDHQTLDHRNEKIFQLEVLPRVNCDVMSKSANQTGLYNIIEHLISES